MGLWDPADDLDARFEDEPGTVLVAWGSQTTRGFRRYDGEIAADGMGRAAKVVHHSIMIAAGALPDMVQGETVTIEGVEYRIRDRLPMDDGALSEVILA